MQAGLDTVEQNVKAVTVVQHGDVAVITIDNPPVNAMSFHVREPLVKALGQLDGNADVAAIVIACAGRTFVAGADITEFGKPMRRPDLRDVIAALEKVEKPTVAAIHGTALGGGLELALGCHFRVADKTARIGLPEVKLGILPGAGGTVRLPRLIGAVKALRMIVTGAPIGAVTALADGAIDAVFEGDLLANAVAFARAKANEDGPFIPVRDRSHADNADLAAFDAEAAALARTAKGLDAPIACAQSVRNGLTMRSDDALDKERELFAGLVAGDQSRAQRHLFFAEREASKVPGVGKDTKARPVRRVGVVGAGTMGGGIAMSFANGGVPVTMLEMNDEALRRGLATIERNYDISVSRGSLSEDVKAKRLSLITGVTDYAALGDCDLVVEAAFEEMPVKKDVFTRLDKALKPGAILASNTSYLDINEIASVTRRPADVVGTHFFSPANVMKLLEIVRGRETAPDILATLLAVARTIGKVPVVVGVCHGFVGNRMLAARSEELESLLLEGAAVADVDKVFTDFGWPMGPFQMADLAGLDIDWRNRKSLGKTAPVSDALRELGRFGQKTGAGFYRYEDGSRAPLPDPVVQKLIEDKAGELGIPRRAVGPQEITERTLYPMINEGARILEEGIATRASDIDIVWVNGYGFPVGKGGPMFWADTEGLDKIVGRLEYWYAKTGKEEFKPSPLLRKLATEGKRLSP